MPKIRSMTAFARQEIHSELATFTWEIKSVNHRYLETGFRLPDKLRQLEPQLRNKLRQSLTRGKVEASLRIEELTPENAELQLDEVLLQQLILANEKIEHLLGASKAISSMDLLRWPGVLSSGKADISDLETAALSSFDSLLAIFVESREREGIELEQMIVQRIHKVSDFVAVFRQNLPETLRLYREKLQSRLMQILEKNTAKVDQDRLEQELVMFAQKVDIEEELERLETHAKEVLRLLNEGGSVGRQLDFLMQELHREANTTGSKSASAEQSQAVIDLKVCIEQMREQIQNIE
jgi:uncharacterized protein (TIGR00255 family)